MNRTVILRSFEKVTRASELRRKKYFDELALRLGVHDENDWYRITSEDVRKIGAGVYLDRSFDSSLIVALQKVYPQIDWHPWKFSHEPVPRNYWNSPDNQRAFVQWLAKELSFKTMEDWYKFTTQDLVSHGGSGFLTKHSKSISKALKNLYPSHIWQEWKFTHVPFHFWDDPKNHRNFLDWLGEQLGFKSLDAWYTVSIKKINTVAQINPFSVGFGNFLQSAYPDHNWDIDKLIQKRTKASQKVLLSVVEEIFPNFEILEDSLHEELRFSKTGAKMQLDIFLPKQNLAFEYQGEQHYKDVFTFGGAQWQYQERDQEKRVACAKKGITLVEVPYWWNFERSSLVATIHALRPDLVQGEGGIPIPKESPLKKGKSKEQNQVET